MTGLWINHFAIYHPQEVYCWLLQFPRSQLHHSHLKRMDNCTFNISTLADVSAVIASAMALLSLVMCVVALIIMMYYKLYHLFIYRLILYLFVSFVIDALGDVVQLPILLWLYQDVQGMANDGHVCRSLFAVQLYSMWNVQLFLTFMTAELFSMTLLSVEFKKVEKLLVPTFFVLPAMFPLVLLIFYEAGKFQWCEVVTNDNVTTLYTNLALKKYNAIAEIVLVLICLTAIVVVISYLACRSVQSFLARTNSETRHLLLGNRHQYAKALRESFPFMMYPVTILLTLLLYYFSFTSCNNVIVILRTPIGANVGSIASATFFLHIKILGRRRRNMFRRRQSDAELSSYARQFSERQKFTSIGSITATHVTDFEPPGESDLESS